MHKTLPVFFRFFNKSITFLYLFFKYINVSKDSSAKYYQNSKGRLQKSLGKIIKVFLKKKKSKATIWALGIQKSL